MCKCYNRLMKQDRDLNQLQSDFISTVSHELRTPLTSIRGFADTLISSRDKLTDEQQIKFLNIIKDQSNRLINLVENLLSASAKASSEEIYVLKQVNVTESVEKIISLIKQKYPGKDIQNTISHNITDVLADKDKFEQILLNIIENACKYSFENSTVEISAKENAKNEVEIFIANNGITIEAKDKSKIFEKFSRLDNPMTRLTQGSGMGLYLSLNMAEKMNGNISFTSENEHTVFTLTLPSATAENIAQNKLKGGKNND